ESERAGSEGGMKEPSLVSDIVLCWAARTPAAVALATRARAFTYAELHEAVERAADWLLRRDVRVGDRLMIVCENSPAAVATILAAMRIGAWPAIVNARISEREVAAIRDHCGARRAVFAIAPS